MLVTVIVVTIMQRYKLIYHLCKKSSFLIGLISTLSANSGIDHFIFFKEQIQELQVISLRPLIQRYHYVMVEQAAGCLLLYRSPCA